MLAPYMAEKNTHLDVLAGITQNGGRTVGILGFSRSYIFVKPLLVIKNQ